jgi:predicted nucleotidyltransferase
MTEGDKQAVREFAGRVRERLGGELTALKLFGSKARGDDTPESDIDILVEVEQATSAIEDAVLDIAFEVNLAHDVYISPRVIARAVFADPVWRITPFIQRLEQEGVPL